MRLRTLAGLLRLYNAKTCYNHGDGLVGVYNRNTDMVDWWRFAETSKHYVMTGSTRNPQGATLVRC